MSAQIEMPKYVSHKQVWALKIAAIEINEDGTATIAPVDERYAPFRTQHEYKTKFKGVEGESEDLGYYVVYRDGYVSWSPTQAFEEGYTKLE